MPAKETGRRAGLFTIGGTLALAALIAGGALWWHSGSSAADVPTRADAPATPVTVATATSRDVPVYLTGLGTVQATNTVSIHTQVNGTLQTVNFTEGQQVHSGDVLAQIDSRLYQAALDQ